MFEKLLFSSIIFISYWKLNTLVINPLQNIQHLFDIIPQSNGSKLLFILIEIEDCTFFILSRL